MSHGTILCIPIAPSHYGAITHSIDDYNGEVLHPLLIFYGICGSFRMKMWTLYFGMVKA
jgi:hypothetical protein